MIYGNIYGKTVCLKFEMIFFFFWNFYKETGQRRAWTIYIPPKIFKIAFSNSFDTYVNVHTQISVKNLLEFLHFMSKLQEHPCVYILYILICKTSKTPKAKYVLIPMHFFEVFLIPFFWKIRDCCSNTLLLKLPTL